MESGEGGIGWRVEREGYGGEWRGRGTDGVLVLADKLANK